MASGSNAPTVLLEDGAIRTLRSRAAQADVVGVLGTDELQVFEPARIDGPVGLAVQTLARRINLKEGLRVGDWTVPPC